MNRSWDAATPRVDREPEDDDEVRVDAREWEEEQVRLDRDWYSSFDEGGVAGDEEHNPFAGFEDFGREKEQEMEAKAVKKITARQAQYVSPAFSSFHAWHSLILLSFCFPECRQRCMGDQPDVDVRRRATIAG
jgi:hypothetical protein